MRTVARAHASVYMHTFFGGHVAAVRRGELKLIVHEFRDAQLFNISADPREDVDISDFADPLLLVDMHEELRRYRPTSHFRGRDSARARPSCMRCSILRMCTGLVDAQLARGGGGREQSHWYCRSWRPAASAGTGRSALGPLQCSWHSCVCDMPRWCSSVLFARRLQARTWCVEPETRICPTLAE